MIKSKINSHPAGNISKQITETYQPQDAQSNQDAVTSITEAPSSEFTPSYTTRVINGITSFPMIYLIEDNTAVWTFDMYNKYKLHEDAYNSFYKDKQSIYQKLSQGEYILRINEACRDRYFKIMYADKMVGELKICHWGDNDFDEISVFIFDKYQKRQFGLMAIRQYIDGFHAINHRLIARIDTTHRFKEKIGAMLRSLGFMYDEGYYIYQE